MTRMTDDRARELLRDALPVPEWEHDGTADLWPRVRRRIDEGHNPPPAVDWVLAMAMVALCLLQPSLLGILLLHF